MTINEFIKEMKNNNRTVSEIIFVKKYISSMDKMNLAKNVMDFSIQYDRGFIKFDSYKKHLAFIFAVIEEHTDLRFADDWCEKICEYDILCENDLFDAVIETFQKDYCASRDVMDMMCSDMLVENSLEASVVKLAQSAAENLDVFVGTLADKLEDLDIEKIIPKDLDLDTLQGFLSNFK